MNPPKLLSPELFLELDKFRNVVFREDIHKYYIDGEECPISTTGLIGKYHEEFDSDYWAETKAQEYAQRNSHVTAEDVSRIWKFMNLHAITEGSCLHNFAELRNNGKILPYPEKHIRDIFGYDPLRSSYQMMEEQYRKFHADITGKLVPIRSELVIGDPEWLIGGMIDQLYWNVKDKEFQIWDWKTNSDLELTSKYKMNDPIGMVPDCAYFHYQLQLSIYKLIVERNTNIRIGKMYIVWFNEKNPTYKILPIKYRHQQVVDMINDWLTEIKQHHGKDGI
jgi:hypothetical protein